MCQTFPLELHLKCTSNIFLTSNQGLKLQKFLFSKPNFRCAYIIYNNMNCKKLKFRYTIFCAATKKASAIKYLLFLLAKV